MKPINRAAGRCVSKLDFDEILTAKGVSKMDAAGGSRTPKVATEAAEFRAAAYALVERELRSSLAVKLTRRDALVGSCRVKPDVYDRSAPWAAEGEYPDECSRRPCVTGATLMEVVDHLDRMMWRPRDPEWHERPKGWRGA